MRSCTCGGERMTTIRNALKLTNAGAAIDRLKKERDTYRELCGELLPLLATMTSLVKTKYGNLYPDVTFAIENADCAITKAEAILGENNAT